MGVPVALVHCSHIIKENISCDNLAAVRKHYHICFSGIPAALKKCGKGKSYAITDANWLGPEMCTLWWINNKKLNWHCIFLISSSCRSGYKIFLLTIEKSKGISLGQHSAAHSQLCLVICVYLVIYTRILVLLLQNRRNSKIDASEWSAVECIKLFCMLELVLHLLVNAEHWKPLCITHSSRKKRKEEEKKHTKSTINCLLCLVWYKKAVNKFLLLCWMSYFL